MKILISGAGIAGPTLAYWLAHYGMEPTIVEKAPKLRSDGYIIDFWALVSISPIAWSSCPSFAAKDTWLKMSEW
jgi:2-polyprenyl-6-methoxyphenol hydroxylase-like FAD-dependent oxidoreductase